jgi:hypothetical protein
MSRTMFVSVTLPLSLSLSVQARVPDDIPVPVPVPVAAPLPWPCPCPCPCPCLYPCPCTCPFPCVCPCPCLCPCPCPRLVSVHFPVPVNVQAAPMSVSSVSFIKTCRFREKARHLLVLRRLRWTLPLEKTGLLWLENRFDMSTSWFSAPTKCLEFQRGTAVIKRTVHWDFNCVFWTTWIHLGLYEPLLVLTFFKGLPILDRRSHFYRG